MPPTVIVITDASLKLAATEAGLVAAPDYQCQVTEAAINTTPNLVTVPATWCSGESQTAGASGAELTVTWLQDWTASGGGLSGYAYTNDATTQWFSLTLEGDTGPPLAKGQVRVVAGAYGGPAGTPLTATQTWPCISLPVITFPTVLMADEASADEEPAEEYAAAS